MAKILVVGNPQSPLVRARGQVGLKDGHQISWFSNLPGNIPNVTFYSLPKLARRSILLRSIFEPIYLARCIRQVNPDLIHVHYASRGFSSLALAKARKPLVVTVMGSDIIPGVGYRFPHAFFTRRLLDAADIVTSKSEYMDRRLLAIGNYGSKIRRITWGVNLNVFRPNPNSGPLRNRLGISPQDIVFLDPRAATPFYNKDLILKAFASYLTSGGPAAFLLIAEYGAKPGYIQKLRGLANKLGINSSVRFIGQVEHNEMASYYSLADITISVPPSDGLPQTFYEAFACGSFIITNDLPQYKGILQDGLNAKLVPAGNIDALHAAMLWASKNTAIRQEARLLGRRYVEKHADEAIETAKMGQVYNALISHG